MSGQEEDEELICGLTTDERDRLQQGLGELADTMPPRAVWSRIREQAEAEGLVGKRAVPARWLFPAGLAAAVLLVAILVPGLRDTTEQAFPVLPDNAKPTNTALPGALEALMVESRRLENDLRSLPAERRVVRAGTQAAIVELEDRIAAIDYQLNDPEIRLSPDDRQIFWRERVRLMNSLVRLRYAQAQRNTY